MPKQAKPGSVERSLSKRSLGLPSAVLGEFAGFEQRAASTEGYARRRVVESAASGKEGVQTNNGGLPGIVIFSA